MSPSTATRRARPARDRRGGASAARIETRVRVVRVVDQQAAARAARSPPRASARARPRRRPPRGSGRPSASTREQRRERVLRLVARGEREARASTRSAAEVERDVSAAVPQLEAVTVDSPPRPNVRTSSAGRDVRREQRRRRARSRRRRAGGTRAAPPSPAATRSTVPSSSRWTGPMPVIDADVGPRDLARARGSGRARACPSRRRRPRCPARCGAA